MHLPPRIQYHIFLICTLLYSTNCSFIFYTLHLSNDERIKAHFLICFLALTIYRILEVKLGNKYTVSEITKTLREMNMLKTKQNDYIPAFNRTQISDDIFEVFEYRLDYEIITEKNMKKILKATTK